MASDFYRFEGFVGHHKVIVDFVDTDHPDADKASVVSIDDGPNAHEFYTLARLDGRSGPDVNAEYVRIRQAEMDIVELIRQGQFDLKFQKCWCPSD
jgi:hypothetical protein